jgi:cytochrome c
MLCQPKGENMQTTKIGVVVCIAGFMLAGSALAQGDASGEPTDLETAALALVEQHGCFTCHAIDKKVIGPAWKDVAAKYRGDPDAEARLVNKVSKGGKGVWGNVMAMPPFGPYVKEEDIRTLVRFVISLK